MKIGERITLVTEDCVISAEILQIRDRTKKGEEDTDSKTPAVWLRILSRFNKGKND